MSEEIQISMYLLRSKIVYGVKRIYQEKEYKYAIFFVGDSGVGKSTLLSYLIGDYLKIYYKGLKPCLVSCNYSQHHTLKIGHNKYSETSIPIRVLFEGKAYYDCQGFNDNNSSYCEIANSFYYQRLMSMYEKIKLVVVIDYNYITYCRAYQMPALARKLQNAFGNLSKTRFSTLFVINRCHSDSTHEDAAKEFEKLIKTYGLFNSEQVRYFDYLIKNNQFFLFKQPKRQDVGNLVNPTERKTFQQKIGYIKYMDKIDIKNIISDQAKLKIRDYLDTVTKRSEYCILKLFEELDKEVAKSKECIFTVKQQILKVFNYRDMMHYKGDFKSFLELCFLRKAHSLYAYKFIADLEIAHFFSNVCSKYKSQSYYFITSTLILAKLSVLLNKIDSMIEEKKLDMQRKKRKQELKIEIKRLEILYRNSKYNIVAYKTVKLAYKYNSSSTIAFQSSGKTKVKYVSNDAAALQNRVYIF